MRTEQEIRDTIKALHGEILKLEQEAMASLRMRQALDTAPDELIRQWADIKREMGLHSASKAGVPYDDRGEEWDKRWGELVEKLYHIENKLQDYAAAKEAA
jgi:hypothetical protein